MVVGNGVAGLWALGAHALPALRRPALWWWTIVVEVALFGEVILGVVRQNVEDIVAPELHALYGFSALVAVGILYSYRASLKDRLYLLYGFGGLFLMGLGIRAMVLR